jgi:ATP-dependent DNA helicase RecG
VVADLLTYSPFRYEDRSNVKSLRDLAPGEMATVLAEVRSTKLSGFRRRNLGLFEATFADASRGVLAGKWFHGAYLADVLAPGQKVALYGKVEFDTYSGHLAMMHPEYEILAEDEDGDASLHTGRIVPVYEAAGKVTTRALRTLLHRILDSVAPLRDDPIPEHIRARLKLPNRWTAIRELHFPAAEADLRVLNSFRSPAQYRLIFEEFFWLECGLELKRAKARLLPGIAFALTDRVRERSRRCCRFARPGRRNACWPRSPMIWRSRIPCTACCKATWAAVRRWWRPKRPSSLSKTVSGRSAGAHGNPGLRNTFSISRSCFRSWIT